MIRRFLPLVLCFFSAFASETRAESFDTPYRTAAIPYLLDVTPRFLGADTAMDLLERDQFGRALNQLAQDNGGVLPKDPHGQLFAAVAYLGDAQPERALQILKGLEAQLPEVSDHIQTLRAEALLALDQPDAALEALKEIPTGASLQKGLTLLLAEGELKQGSPEKALEALRPLTDGQALPDLSPKTLLLKGRALEASQKAAQRKLAAAHFRTIVVYYPLSRRFDEAKRLLARLKKRGMRVSQLSPDERTIQATAYLRANLNRKAIQRLKPVWSIRGLSKRLNCDIAYNLGVAYQNLREYTQGRPYLRAAAKYCEEDRAVKALYRWGRGEIRSGRLEAARQPLRTLAATHPNHSYADDALYLLGVSLQDEGKLKEGEALLMEQIKTFPHGDMRSEATWRLAWIDYRQGELSSAIARLESLLAAAQAKAREVAAREAAQVQAQMATRGKENKEKEGEKKEKKENKEKEKKEEEQSSDGQKAQAKAESTPPLPEAGPSSTPVGDSEVPNRSIQTAAATKSDLETTPPNTEARAALPGDPTGATEASSPSQSPRFSPDVPSPHHSREVYWHARWLELSGPKRRDAAQAEYEALARWATTDYYGLLAYHRLEAMAPDKTGAIRAAALKTLSVQVSQRPLVATDYPTGVAGAVSLLRAGLRKLAVDELREVHRQLPQAEADDRTALVVALLLEKTGAYKYSHRIPRVMLKEAGAAPITAANRLAFYLAFPPAFEAPLRKAAEKFSVDPLLMMALAREESAFDPKIRSYAGAIGLIQLMPGTASWMGKKLKKKRIRASQLIDPTLNAELGTFYMQRLLRRFGGHPGLAVPSYNAGEGAINRWLRERGDLPFDEWVEEVPYKQTRDYVKRVLSSYQTYQYLYRPKTPFIEVSLTLPQKS